MQTTTETSAPLPQGDTATQASEAVGIVDLGDRLRVTVEIPVEEGDTPSRRRALAKAWEVLAAAISEMKATLPPVPVPPKPARKRARRGRGVRTGSGSWWQF